MKHVMSCFNIMSTLPFFFPKNKKEIVLAESYDVISYIYANRAT